MATYIASINYHWPDWDAESTTLITTRNEELARQVLENALTEAGFDWRKVNSTQYGAPNSNVGDVVMGNIFERLTDEELRQRWIKQKRAAIERLEAELAALEANED